MRLRILGPCGCLLLATAPWWAQSPVSLPSRVARLSYTDGTVSLRPAGSDSWMAATLNYPLSNGDRLWTAEDSFADVDAGASVLHLAPQTSLAVLYLTGRRSQLSLSEGSVNVHIPLMDEGELFEIDTPNCAISILHPGGYRIDASPDGEYTLITVRSGDAEVAAGGRTFPVHAGKMLRVFSSPQVTLERDEAAEPDPWDDWCQGRDELEDSATAESAPYVAPEMVGAEDLGQYGDWETDADYGAVWTPRDVSPEWCPYRFGHWIYKAPWGWTWIDEAPWGFAPFHYGHWVRIGEVWKWVPGPRVIHPVYVPAQVAFVDGWGSGFVAWIPLGPREARGQTAPFVNRLWATAVPQTVFAGTQPVAPSRVRGTVADPRAVSAPMVPPRGQTHGGHAAPAPPAEAEDRTVVLHLPLPAGVRPPVPVMVNGEPRPRQQVESGAPVAERPPAAPRIDPQETQPQAVNEARPPVEQRQMEQRRADQQRLVDEQQREAQRQLEAQRQAEAQRQQQAQRQQEAQWQQETQRQQEAQRQAEARRQEEAQRQAQAEAQRQQESQRQAEAQRQEEQRRAEEQKRQDDQKKKQ